MIINCDACSASLQMDETKITVGKFTVRCPKCRNLVRIFLREGNKVEIEKDEQAKSKETRNVEPNLPASFDSAMPSGHNSPLNNDLIRALSGLMQQNNSAPSTAEYYDDGTQNVLICLPEPLRAAVTLSLNNAGWKTHVADKPTQALDMLEDLRIKTVVYSPKFAHESRGAFALENYLYKKVPSERRKIFAVMLSEEAQTCNAHEAFLKNLNLVVNVEDAPNLPLILRRSRRSHDEVYRHYNQALANVL